ncbi:hypothetical protein CTEN210_07741 [Chaetoceros tenuissimus]|uniref:Uncharacterized protein n=1 Tax=Chaetoceros tenuissimus TaxID=426638 RepID=A0AAD3CUG1_9STRA|nr:hypothetical protein CTEN210_07741 [Chaetoceros tenuissimus]
MVDLIDVSFEELQHEWQEKGFVSEAKFDDLDFPKDVYEDEDKRVNRDTDAESRQRAKTLNHRWQIENRLKIKMAIQEKVDKKNRQLRLKARQHVDNNEKASQYLSRMITDARTNENTNSLLQQNEGTNSLKKKWKALCKEGSDSNVTLVDFATLDDMPDAILDIMLDTLTMPILQSFGVVREYSFDTVSNIRNLPNKKNEVIEYAKQLMKKPPILFVPILDIQLEDNGTDDQNNDSDDDTVDLTEGNTNENAIPISLSQKKPSEYLQEAIWRRKFSASIKGVRRIEVDEEVEDTLKEDANVLLEILQNRFEMHFETHHMINYREHECFVWTERNLPRLCAAITLASHTKKDLRNQFVTRSTTVLGNPCTSTTSIFCNARDEPYTKLHGCYLYYDRESGKWVRSGKAGGNGKTTFQSRDKEHAKASRELQSSFYMAYADKDVVSECREGSFQDLNQYCGLSFDPEDVEQILNMDDGLLQWTHGIKDWIEEYCKKRDNMTQKETQLMLVAYLFELAYELCIGMLDNKSQSGGFEAAVGRHSSN